MLIRKNIDTAKKVLGKEFNGETVEDSAIHEAKAEAVKIMEEAGKDTKADEEMLTIAYKLEKILKEELSNKDDDENLINEEFVKVGTYQAERVSKMRKLMEEKLTFHKNDLLKKWEEQSEFLDYQGLKEF